MYRYTFFSFLFFLGLFISRLIFADGYYQWPIKDFTHLNVGIYWVGKGNTYCPANANKKNESITCQQAFDPNKPTMLFIHGWEPESVRYLERFEFYYIDSQIPKTDYDYGRIWRKKGWNVGIFYWNQISDTTYPAQAAAKIWTAKSSQKMYWIKYNPNEHWYHDQVSYEDACANSKSTYCKPVGMILYSDYVKAMQNYRGHRIRIIGHSLGGQLAIYLTHQIVTHVEHHQLSPRLIPRQLVLLDPYFSKDNSYLDAMGIDNFQLANQYVKQFADEDGIVVSEYLSSSVTWPLDWGDIEKVSAVTYYRPWFDWSWRQDEKHEAAWIIYLLSMKDKPPKTYIRFNQLNHQIHLTTLPGLSASTPIYQTTKNAQTPVIGVAAMMGIGYYWDQDCGDAGKLCGEYTLNTTDDAFLELKSGYGLIRPLAKRIIIDAAGREINNHDRLTIPMSQKGLRLHATVMPIDARNRIILWQSSNPNIVRVFPGGYVRVFKPGVVTVSAIVPEITADSTLLLKKTFMIQVSPN